MAGEELDIGLYNADKSPLMFFGASEFSLRKTDGQWQAVRALSVGVSA